MPSPTIVALVSGFGWHVEDLRRASGLAGVNLHAVPFPTVVGRVGLDGPAIEAGGVDLRAVDGVLVRMMPPGSLEQVVFRMDALHRLQAAGVPVLNSPRAVETAVDKYLTLARVEAAGLPVPATWVGEGVDDALEAFQRLGGDVVVKPLFGSEGRGLLRVSHLEMARRVFATLARIGAVLYVQAFIRHRGSDLRAVRARRARCRGDPPRGGRRGSGGRTSPSAAGRRRQRSTPPTSGWRSMPPAPWGGDGGSRPDRRPGARRPGRPRGQRRPRLACARRGHGRRRGEADPRTPEGKAMTPGAIAQIACLLEVTAKKPGNVHRGADFAGDAHYLDFLLSASAIVGPLDRAAEIGVGRAVLEAVEATRQVVSTNTNLGMILALAPLAAVPGGEPLRSGVAEVLRRTTIADADAVYRAIRLARPGGLGDVADQDVAAPPTVGLVDAMRFAADRDGIARLYATDFADLFDLTLPALNATIAAGRPLEAAIVACYLATLADRPDTLIARKRGPAVAAEASRRAREAIKSGDHTTLDAWLREDGHARNPGATADLVAAGLFAAIRNGTIRLPIVAGDWS